MPQQYILTLDLHFGAESITAALFFNKIRVLEIKINLNYCRNSDISAC